jgi:hypothetical protein
MACRTRGSRNSSDVASIGIVYHCAFFERAMVARSDAATTRAVAKSRFVCEMRSICPASRAFTRAVVSWTE